MRAKIQQWMYYVRGSYWFVPTMMAIGAIVLSQVMVELDRRLGSAWMIDAWWASLNQPEGARTLLATVAGSMITVAGVTFSLTILAVSYATSHFGPRLLDNFMRDRGNQVTLGTFLATFLYCLLVLRTVRSGSDIFQPSDNGEVFVPHLSVLLAVAMTLASVGVLIYFIHHIPESIHISNVLDRISGDLSEKIQELYPESLGEDAAEKEADQWSIDSEGKPIRNLKSGYLQGIDATGLLETARKADATIELHVRPGDFLLEGQTVATLSFRGRDGDKADQCQKDVLRAFAIGVTRTPTQDIHFILAQFFEIAVRALSPGVNDPRTAIQCIDQLAKGLVELSQRTMPPRHRKDSEGVIRVVTTETSWDDLVDASLRRLIPYARRDALVLRHLRFRIDSILESSDNDELNRRLKDVATLVDEYCRGENA